MADNLSDPAFEPSDEQLQQLSRDAFADLGAQRLAADAKLRAEIAAFRASVASELTRGSGR